MMSPPLLTQCCVTPCWVASVTITLCMPPVCIHSGVLLMTACCIVIQVHMPLPVARLEELCYSGLEATKSERNAVVHSLLQTLYHLEASVGIGSEVRNVIEGGGGDWMGQYMVKREYSEGSFHVFGIVVPDLRNTHASFQAQQPEASSDAPSSSSAEAGADQHAINNDADPRTPGTVDGICGRKQQPTSRAIMVMHKAQALIWPLVPERIAHFWPVARLLGMGSHTSSSNSCNSSGDTTQQTTFCPNEGIQAESGESRDLNKVNPADELLYLSTASESVLYRQAGAVGSSLNAESKAVSVPDVLPDLQTGDAVLSDTLIPTRHDSSAEAVYDHMDGPHVSHGYEYDFAGWKISAELVSLLEVTADRILKESCGEGWLLQPRIADMTRLEYRVYMLNGAQAVSGSADVHANLSIISCS